ncbi:unnamed protein product [Linum tenue]|uniref:ACB domain-containing protein n=1 Tax=Linum tenue TaxID=586396 RepID=A0AAV0P2L7_9ROSI|nr:unnamed protein product [Linum tenue]
MELFQELVLTLLVALLSSFLIAKAVSRATGGGSGPDDGSSKVVSSARSRDQEEFGDVTEEVIMEELNYAGRLETRGLESEGVVDFVEESVEEVEEFVGEPAPVNKEASGNECREVTEKVNSKAAEEIVPVEVNEGVAEEAKGGETVEIESSRPPEAAAEESSDEVAGGGKKVEIEIDDDWEGIERSDLEEVFAKASKFVESGYGEEKLASIGSDVQMELYGLHKLVTEGPCHEQPPMALKLSARAKWNSWQKLGNMDPEVAMEQYVTLLSDNVPRWTDEKSVGVGTSLSSEAVESGDSAADISSPASHHPNFPYERGSELKHDSKTSEPMTGDFDAKNTVKE